ncbi:MAG: hypothetical protein Q4B32_10765, partial [Clostridia bacterium]|nr:hypothetical protein [Clostridia bacterium]
EQILFMRGVQFALAICVSISSFHRTEIRDGITAMFDYDTIEAWETRHPDIENYKNYYDWVMTH